MNKKDIRVIRTQNAIKDVAKQMILKMDSSKITIKELTQKVSNPNDLIC